MKKVIEIGTYSIIVGVLATAFLDLWNLLRFYFVDVPLTKYEFIGRWMLYMLEGKFSHVSIKQSAPVPGELLVGWLGHYAIGIAFAAILLIIWGIKWLKAPTFKAAMLVGMGTVVVPYFIMQPGMGLGIAGSASPDQIGLIVKVIVSHIVFSIGLYATGQVVKYFSKQPKA